MLILKFVVDDYDYDNENDASDEGYDDDDDDDNDDDKLWDDEAILMLQVGIEPSAIKTSCYNSQDI
jgi:hypothetical protein